jgi:hypothetical protein
MAKLSPAHRRRLRILVAALWWGSLTLLGAVVVPSLFAHLATPAMAGSMAAKLFSAQTWVSTVCGLLLLMLSAGPVQGAKRAATAWVLAGTLLALLLEFAVAPRILARENMALWHGLGVLFFALQWLCAQVALWQASDSEH